MFSRTTRGGSGASVGGAARKITATVTTVERLMSTLRERSSIIPPSRRTVETRFCANVWDDGDGEPGARADGDPAVVTQAALRLGSRLTASRRFETVEIRFP